MHLLLVEGQILRDDIDYDADVADLALEVSLVVSVCATVYADSHGDGGDDDNGQCIA